LIESDGLRFVLGAQNCHSDEKGAFTGEVSPAFLAKLGVRLVICGHSERRQLFGETDDFVAAKVASVIKFGMTPIVCVGETQEEREAGVTLDRVSGQLRGSLKGRSKSDIESLVIAYEPIWAIGTGLTATATDAQEVCAAIRNVVRSDWGAEAAAAVRIQYGGSVKAGNVVELMAQPDIDGALVGGASIDPDEFARLVQFER
jgi:triosephosphate isomerase